MRIQIREQGIPEAVELMSVIGHLGSDIQGVELHGVARKGAGEKGDNAQLKGYLADGGRDLGPGDEDAKEASIEYAKIITRYLKTITQRIKPMPALGTRARAAAAKRQARVKKAQAKGKVGAAMAEARAYKRAEKLVGKLIADRMEDSEDKNGNVQPVDPDYAKERAKKFGVPDDPGQVFKASGQLLANYASGRAKIVKK